MLCALATATAAAPNVDLTASIPLLNIPNKTGYLTESHLHVSFTHHLTFMHTLYTCSSPRTPLINHTQPLSVCLLMLLPVTANAATTASAAVATAAATTATTTADAVLPLSLPCQPQTLVTHLLLLLLLVPVLS